ncbi:helix-turn-helix transcriptional regulator [Brucella ciceri]|uniref:helix-turn-helix domain-containing protein n=1 Tax=Brucella ciceri TaxID=391287 RepID=UPI001F141123|nr:helix-turn-helix transcriptional regulator [Brucella ciceri]MCH6203879.1 helix-turn-helix transcriptional regulator [Brucella ciceri]
MNKLRTYLKDRGVSHKAFGEAIGVTQATINRYVNGERFPSQEIIVKIAQATEGEISPADWFSVENITPMAFDASIGGDRSLIE